MRPLSLDRKRTERVMRLLRAVYIAAEFGYAIFLLRSFGWPARPGPLFPRLPLTLPLIVVALVTAMLIPIVPRVMVPDAALRRMLADAGGSAADGVSRDRRLDSIASVVFPAFIAEIALAEAIGLYGVVLGFFSRSAIPFFTFGVFSIVLLLSIPPSIDPFLERARRSIGPI